MPATLEAAVVVATLIVPGFVGFYVSRELTPFPIKQVSDAELVLLSTAFATVILTCEIGLYAVVVGFSPDLPLLAGVSSAEIRDAGYHAALEAHPARVAGIFSAQFVLHCIVVALLGWFDPLGKVLERTWRRRGASAEDVWTRGLVGLRQEKGLPSTFVRAVLETGETYWGILSKISNHARDDGGRDIVLQAVSKSSSVDQSPAPLHGDRPEDTVVALSTRNLRAVEAVFHDPFE